MDEFNIAMNAFNGGKITQAAVTCRGILKERPNDASALFLMGMIYDRQGNHDKAIRYHQRAHRLQPENITILYELGRVNLSSGRFRKSEIYFRKIISRKPDFAGAFSSLGNALTKSGRFNEAIKCHERALELEPLSSEYVSNCGYTHLSSGNIDLAVEYFSKAVNLRPNSSDMHFNLGTAYQIKGEYEKSASCFILCLKLYPNHIQALMNLGLVCKAMGFLDDAVSYIRYAIELDPDFVYAKWNLSMILIMAGDYENGWKMYEWRCKIPEIPICSFSQHKWDGSLQKDKTLLVHAEQGLGDTLQFARFLALAKERVGRLIFDCQAPLTRLLAGIEGADMIIPRGEPLPLFDLHIPLLSLPMIFKTTRNTIPVNIPYIRVEHKLIDKWSNRLSQIKGFKVGICWQGSPVYEEDRNRSIPLKYFLPLAQIKGVQLISLQKKHGLEQLEDVEENITVIDLGRELDDSTGAFVDTSAVMKSLDLVITSDTAIPHLAGSLGINVWLLLSYVPDWRFGMSGDDYPWYPTMRIFRQTKKMDWEDVFKRVGNALEIILAESKNNTV